MIRRAFFKVIAGTALSFTSLGMLPKKKEFEVERVSDEFAVWHYQKYINEALAGWGVGTGNQCGKTNINGFLFQEYINRMYACDPSPTSSPGDPPGTPSTQR